MIDQWNHIRLGDVVTLDKGVTYASSDYSDADGGLPFITIKCVQKGGGFDWTGLKYYAGPFLSSQALSHGDILLALTDLTRDGDIIGNPIAVPRFPGVKTVLASMDLCKLRPLTQEIDLAYLFYRFMLSDVHGFMLAHSAGSTVLHLEKRSLPHIGFDLPPLPQQRKIATILTTVDNLIEKTETLIAKYQAVKQGMMHDLFTRGVDDHGHLRPTYDEAPELYKESELGWIPKEWDAVHLASLYEVPSRNGLYKPANFYGSGYPMVHMPQMFRALTVDMSDAARVQVDGAELRRFALEEGDLLFARRSLTLEGAGQCSLVSNLREATTFESSIIRVRLDQKRVLPSFVNQFLNTPTGYIYRLPFIRQVAVSGVSAEDVAAFPVPCPRALSEQAAIMDRLSAVDARAGREEKYLRKLAQSKRGLMQDLLTGRVRVIVAATESKNTSD